MLKILIAMTKYYYIFVCFIFCLFSCSKNNNLKTKNKLLYIINDTIIDKPLNDKDTIYFYFDYSENLKKGRIYIDTIKNDTFINYRYFESKINKYGRKREFALYRRGNYITNTKEKKIADIKLISNRFIRKNKDIIIYPEDLKGSKMYQYVATEFIPGKIYYVIDIKEKKGNKFVAREVRYNFGTFLEI